MLELRDIFVEADGKEILSGVNLVVESPMFVVVTGPNGSGKSTLAKVIAGIVKPSQGSILYNGKDITGLNITERAKAGIGFAFQQPVRFRGLTVIEMLSIAAGRSLCHKEACSYLRDVGMCANDYVNREIDDSLSGGEIKRIEIAMLMARQASVSIFDEPEAGIDLWSFSMLVNSFQKFKENKEQTVIIISHQERVIDLADEIMIIANGKIKNKGPKEQIMPLIQAGPTDCGCPIKEVALTHEK